MAKKEVSALIAAIDPYVAALLGRISEGKRVISIQKGKRIFSQGDRADAIYFVQSGTVKVSVSETRASVVSIKAAMEAAFWRAERVTLVGSRIPARIISV